MKEMQFRDLTGLHCCDSIEELTDRVYLIYGVDLRCQEKVDICYFGCSNQTNDQPSQGSNDLRIPGADVACISSMFMAAARLLRFDTAHVLLPDPRRTMMPFLRDDLVVFSTLEPGRSYKENDERFAAEALFSLGEEYFIDRYRKCIQRMRYVADLRGIDVRIEELT